jgi:glucokinase
MDDKPAHLLAADVGGTKTALELFVITPGGLRSSREATFPSRDYASLDALVREFAGDVPIERACFAVAGPVDGGVARITNLPWILDERELASSLEIPTVSLVNDLRAAAFGMLYLSPTDFEILRPGEPSPTDATIGVIAPGTGLGQCLLYWDGAGYHAIPSEGGHADFAPHDDQEVALHRYLEQRYGHASYERVLSGDGIGNIYSFLRVDGPREPTWVAERLAQGDRNAAISELALTERDPTCVRALDIFCAVLGAEAGNLALRGVASGGVIIGGGIAPRILPLLRRGPLLQRFDHKGRFSDWARSRPVRVALEQKAPLIGAAHWHLRGKPRTAASRR